MKKTLTLALTGYIVKGTADVKPWGGGNACIQMDAFEVEKIDKSTLKKHINDGGFGVESINGAICDIFENYEGTLKYIKTVEVGNISENTRQYYEGGL